MRYLIYIPGSAPFITRNFQPENHFSDGMMVFDMHLDKYTTDGINWYQIEYDSL